LPDVEAAQREAQLVLADFARGRIVDDLSVVVRTEEKRLLTVSLTICVRTE
jgi:hypothetical protein